MMNIEHLPSAPPARHHAPKATEAMPTNKKNQSIPAQQSTDNNNAFYRDVDVCWVKVGLDDHARARCKA
eukprot:2497103-Amphidinium_carterae.1